MEHGIKRFKQSPEALQAKRQREKSKIKEYLALTNDVLTRKKNRDWGLDALDLTSRLLHVNPEFYSVWNYRRNIFINGIFPNSTPQQVNDLLGQDLMMTTVALKAHPKVYWIWNHRRWCLNNVPDGPGREDGELTGWKMANWEKELFVAEKMLSVDARNFLAWDYRRYVVASMPVRRSDMSELAYTTKKIEANFSNFSAWHQRSKILTSVWRDGTLDPVCSQEEEFELVRNAMYTDPADQSVWMYHRWLVGDNGDILNREIRSIQELLDEQPDSKWCMESLVHYKRLLVRNHTSSLTTEERESLIKSCIDLLRELQTIDPLRSQRYDDLASIMMKGQDFIVT